MAGLRPGPPPKREGERIRKEKPAPGREMTVLSEDDLEALPFQVDTLVEPPPGDPNWHPVAERIYQSLLRDPARIWMGPTAWAVAWLLCENVSRQMYPQVVGIVDGGVDPDTGERVPAHVAREKIPMKGTDLAALLKWCAANGIHEAERLSIQKQISFTGETRPAREVTEDEVASTREGFFIVAGEQA